MNYPQPPPGYRATPWWLVLLIVLGALVVVTVLGIVVFFGLIAFACSKH
jgi:hypothetical protein